MNTTLILLTKQYPYGIGEEFIQAELDVLTQSFKRVIVVACQVPSRDKITRQLPERVECIRIDGLIGKMRYIRYMLKGIWKKKEYYEKVELACARTLRAKTAVLYYIGKLSSMYPKVKAAINELNLSDCESITIYSYWLFDTAHIACLLRDDCLQRVNCKAVSRAHGFDLYSERNAAGYLPFQEWMIEHLDGVYPCSKHGHERLQKLYPDFTDKIKTAYLGTKNCGEGKKSIDGKFRIVTCSWLSKIKRTDLFERALCLAQDRIPGRLQWTCIGGGELLAQYKAYAEQNLSKMEFYFLGPLKTEKVLELYKDNPVDLFVNVSESEGLPVSIMEAQSFGIPTLATDVGGTCEIVLDSITGKLLSVDCMEQEIADAIVTFANMNEYEIDLLRENCRSNWLNYFEARANYAAFIREIA